MNELASATVAPAAAPAVGGQELAPVQAPEIPSPLAEVTQGVVPAALLAPVEPDAALDPAQSFLIDNFEKLAELGLDVYEAPDLSTVVFNTSLVDRKAVEAAAAGGTLQQLLTPPAQAGAELAPNPAAAQVAQTRAAQRPEMPVQSAPMVAPKVPASTQTALAKVRARAITNPKATPGGTPVTTGTQLSKRPV